MRNYAENPVLMADYAPMEFACAEKVTPERTAVLNPVLDNAASTDYASTVNASVTLATRASIAPKDTSYMGTSDWTEVLSAIVATLEFPAKSKNAPITATDVEYVKMGFVSATRG